jgi:succinylarginine dihydrolase
MSAFEVNFDGLVGPTHNYAGLSFGNVASLGSASCVSRPKAAAKQGLEKMKTVADLGVRQAVLPPQERPDIAALRRIGFSGDDIQVIEAASREVPAIFQACCSASSMWTANAATVAPSADTADGRVHFTPANLSNKFHRSLEHPTTGRVLRAIFPDEAYFAHHPALPAGNHFSDEGAANHTRLCRDFGESGVHFFVFGRYAFRDGPAPRKFPARQTFEASRAVARLHRLAPARVVLAQQNPDIIDQGVFHNDVIAVGNGNVLLYHELAFLKSDRVLAELRDKLDAELHPIEIQRSRVSVEEAVGSYLFNSQLVTLPDGGMAIVAPMECAENPRVRQCLAEIVDDPSNPLTAVHYLDVRESMRNGGGPACLRQRVVLTETEIEHANPAVFLDDRLFKDLDGWIERHYRDRLTGDDLGDPALLDESRAALDELTRILNLGGAIYPFQRP